MRNLLGYIKEIERKEEKNCFVCNSVMKLEDEVFHGDTCSKECRAIAREHSYFDTDGKLKLTELGLSKINK